MKVGSKGRPVWKFCLEMAIVIVICVAPMLVCQQNNWGLFSRKLTDLTAEYEPKWRTQFRAYLHLPREAKLASYQVSAFVGGSDHTISFTLPDTKEPAEWLAEMTKGLTLGKRMVTPLRYEAQPYRDHAYSVEYQPEGRVYVLLIKYS